MRLKDAAKRFNDAQAYDAYTSDPLFKCQFTSFDDHSADGATARRRVLNIPENLTIPTRRCIRLYDQAWLVGVGSPDSFAGSAIRVQYGMKKATDLALLATPAGVLTSTGMRAYVQKHYYRDNMDTKTESDNQIAWNVFVAPVETVITGMFIVADVLLRVRNTYLPVEGLRVAQCDDLGPVSIVAATFTENGTYNPLTDTWGTVNIATTVILVDYARLYQLASKADPTYEPGDVSVLVRQAAVTPAVGARFTMNGKTWRVLSVQSELDSWLLHARIG